MKKVDVIEKKNVSVLTQELSEKVKAMRMRYALYRVFC